MCIIMTSSSPVPDARNDVNKRYEQQDKALHVSAHQTVRRRRMYDVESLVSWANRSGNQRLICDACALTLTENHIDDRIRVDRSMVTANIPTSPRSEEMGFIESAVGHVPLFATNDVSELPTCISATNISL